MLYYCIISHWLTCNVIRLLAIFVISLELWDAVNLTLRPDEKYLLMHLKLVMRQLSLTYRVSRLDSIFVRLSRPM